MSHTKTITIFGFTIFILAIAILAIMLFRDKHNNSLSESVLAKEIANICKKQRHCTIVMKDLITENWDKMYVFKLSAHLQDINRALGFEYHYFEDIATRIVFVKDSIVVYHEDEFPDPESPKNNELIFDIEDRANYKMYTPNNAIFDIQTVNFNKNSKYYKLTQVNKN